MKRFLAVCALLIVANVCWAGTQVRLVATNSPNPGSPYFTWDTAAHTIQEAIIAATVGDEVWVTDGVYQVGGTVTPGSPGFTLTNRVTISKEVYVHSVNGPGVTTILGRHDPVTGGAGSNAVRCAFVDAGGTLSGFTLQDGASATEPNSVVVLAGGGLMLQNGTVSNCIIQNCYSYFGGGVCMNGFSIQLSHSIIRDNIGGLGGGVYFNNGGEVRNCFILGNGSDGGGGVYNEVTGRVDSCTIAGNIASNGPGGGVDTPFGTPSYENCIIFGNKAFVGDDNFYTSTNIIFNRCCIQPLPPGTNNINADPQFLGSGNYHLRATSACVDAGTNQTWMTGAKDIDGEPRIRGARTDIGADEAYQFMAIAFSNNASKFSSTWATITDAAFRLQYSTDLLSGAWSNVGAVVTSVSAKVSVTETNPPSPERFYKMIYVGP